MSAFWGSSAAGAVMLARPGLARFFWLSGGKCLGLGICLGLLVNRVRRLAAVRVREMWLGVVRELRGQGSQFS